MKGALQCSHRLQFCRGSVMLVVIGSLIVLSVIGAMVSKQTGSMAWTEIQENRLDEAYYAALSGYNYGVKMVKLANEGEFGSDWDMSKLAGNYTIGDGRKFVLQASGISGNDYTLSSQGVVQSGAGKETNHLINTVVTFTPPSNLGDYNFLNPSNRPDYAVYSTSQTRDIPTNFDNSDITTQNLTVGKNYTFGFGNIWYTGTNAGLSSKGVSAFGTGFRIFFTFEFSTNIGDGFVVSILNASQNNYLSSGGDSAEGGLLGYAGDSRVYNSSGGGFASTVLEYVDKSGFTKGLNPPKFGIEIDTYKNDSTEWYPTDTVASCKGDNGLMNDSTYSSGGNSIEDHVGIMYWGTDAAYLRKTCYGPGSSFLGNVKRYSDVRHGSGSNASNSWSNKLKYMNFVAGRTYFFRMDVLKSGTNVSIKSWVGTCSGDDLNTNCTNQVYGRSSNSSSHAGTLSDTQVDFESGSSDLNRLSYVYVNDTLNLTSAENTKFTNFMWGFTSGSGVATQQIDFRNISLSFR